MTLLDDTQYEDEELDLAAPETRAAGRWNSAGVPGERSKDFRSAIRRLFRMLGPMKVVLVVVAVVAIASATLNVLGPKVLGHATDVIITGLTSGQGIDFGELHRVLMVAVLLYATSAALSIVASYMLAGVIQRLMYRLRSDVEDKVNVLPLSYIDRQQKGDLLSRVTNDIDNVAQSLQQTLSQMLTSVLLLLGTAIMMFTISPLLAVVALTTVPVSVWGMQVVAKRARPKFISQWKHTGILNAQIEETFTGHAIVKSFGRQREVEERFRETNEELYESSFGAQFMSSLMQPWTMFLGNIQYVIVAVVGGLRVASGAITVGDIQAFIQYSRTFSMPLTQLASIMNVFQSGIASFERVVEFLDADEQSLEALATGGHRADRGPGRVPRRHLLLRPRGAVDRVALARRGARPDRGDRRPDRRGQDHAREPDHAVLRAERRRDPARRPRHLLDAARGAALEDRHGAAGHVAVRRHDPRQHRVRQPRCERGTDPRGRQGDLRRPLRALAARRLRHDDQRRRRQHQRRAEAAAHDRPRVPRRPFDPDPRRGDELGRHAHRGPDPGSDERAAQGAHELRDRAPPLDDPRAPTSSS